MFIESYSERVGSMMVGGASSQIPYPRISTDDWHVWTNFLPVRSLTIDKAASRNFGYRLLYVGEAVPFEVASEIRRASKYFDEIEIWRKHEIQKDPIAVGVLQGERYMIARWGLEELLPFEKIKTRMPLILLWKYGTHPLGLMTSAAAIVLSLIAVASLAGF
jgi:hypothetical protein